MNGLLEVTRAFGDFDVVGIIAAPAIYETQLTSDDEFIIVASDGLWDVVTPQEAVRTFYQVQKSFSAAMTLH